MVADEQSPSNCCRSWVAEVVVSLLVPTINRSVCDLDLLLYAEQKGILKRSVYQTSNILTQY